jgi:hypothetical protein
LARPRQCWTACRSRERDPIDGSEGEGVEQELQGVFPGQSMDATFQIADAARAHARPLGERLLGQPGGDPMTS